MDESRSDAASELDELRKRAYGPHPDIPLDPAALARLRTLEAASTASPPASSPAGADTQNGELAAAADAALVADSVWIASSVDRRYPAAGNEPVVASSEGSPRSLWHRLTAERRARRGSVIVGALVALLAVVYAVTWFVGPHPDATLHLVEHEGDGAVLSILEFLGADADPSTIRGYQPYRGFEPWFSEEKSGLQCFMIIEPVRRSVDGANCVPPGVELFADIGKWPRAGSGNMGGLPDGSVIRFHYRGESVDVFLYPAPSD